MILLKVPKAVIARFIFSCHAVLAIGRVARVKDSLQYWALATPLIGLPLELLTTLARNDGNEWKWFSPSVFFYLASVIPSVWFLEFEQLVKRIKTEQLRQQQEKFMEQTKRINSGDIALKVNEHTKTLKNIIFQNTHINSINNDTTNSFLETAHLFADDYLRSFESCNGTNLRYTREVLTYRGIGLRHEYTTTMFPYRDDVLATPTRHDMNSLTNEKGITKNLLNVVTGMVPTNLFNEVSDQKWLWLIEQSLLLILIIGRWLLPKGEITRDQLSQLLLVYIGMAADIIELFEAFKEGAVQNNVRLVAVVLALWTVSLMQFTLVITATKKSDGDDDSDDEEFDALHTFDFDEKKNNIKFDLESLQMKKYHAKENEVFYSPDLYNGENSTQNNDSKNFDEKFVHVEKRLEEFKKNEREKRQRNPCARCCETEIWSLCTGIVMQDGPFLGLRLSLILYYKVVSDMNIFFTIKNSLVIILQLYRLIVLTLDHRKQQKDVQQLKRNKRKKKYEAIDKLASSIYNYQKNVSTLTPSDKRDNSNSPLKENKNILHQSKTSGNIHEIQHDHLNTSPSSPALITSTSSLDQKTRQTDGSVWNSRTDNENLQRVKYEETKMIPRRMDAKERRKKFSQSHLQIDVSQLGGKDNENETTKDQSDENEQLLKKRKKHKEKKSNKKLEENLGDNEKKSGRRKRNRKNKNHSNDVNQTNHDNGIMRKRKKKYLSNNNSDKKQNQEMEEDEDDYEEFISLKKSSDRSKNNSFSFHSSHEQENINETVEKDRLTNFMRLIHERV
ncbi:hypothetical protein SNEBB_001833 [Seison nebaliae]|nr:hypothetical protein SNEBB_001833 [Seison nebaliae]